METRYYKDLHGLVNLIQNQQSDYAYEATQKSPAERDLYYGRLDRVYDRLKDCVALCEALDSGDPNIPVEGSDTTASLRRSLEAMAGGKYKLAPVPDPLCLSFQIAGMYGEMVFHWNAREWSLHT